MTAQALLRRLSRAIQQINDDNPETRRVGLETLDDVFGTSVALPSAAASEMLHVLSRPLLRRFEDQAEKNREIALKVFSALVDRAEDVRSYLPLIFPVLYARGNAAHFDSQIGLFTHDAESLDAFKRGKAIQRPDFDAALERERIFKVTEPSEELRAMLCRLLIVLLMKSPTFYLHEGLSLLAGATRDPFAEVQVRAANGIAQLCRVPLIQDLLVPYGSALARAVMPMLRHRHARVRTAAVRALHRSVAITHKAKWRGAGTDAIADLVGFREDNVIPTASFYQPEVRYNYLAGLTRDASVAVRLATIECLADWFSTLLDRRDHQPRLLAYMLNYAIDDAEEVRLVALAGLEVAGKEYASEARGDDVIDRLQYGVDGDGRANHDPAGLPWPFETRPSLGARMIVRAFCHRFLGPTLDELVSWRTEARRQSALLLRVVIVYCEDHLTQELARLVSAFCRTLKKARREADEKQRDLVLDCCRTLGRYVVPESILQFLSPRVRGDVAVISEGGTDASGRADITIIFGRLMRGSKPSALLSQATQIVSLFTDDKLVLTEDKRLRCAILGALHEFLSILLDRGRAALEAMFLETGRLASLDRAIDTMIRAILAWRRHGDIDDQSHTALEALAAIDNETSVIAIIAKRCPKMFPQILEESLEFHILEQTLQFFSRPRGSASCVSTRSMIFLLKSLRSTALQFMTNDDDENDEDIGMLFTKFSLALVGLFTFLSEAEDDDVGREAEMLLREYVFAERWRTENFSDDHERARAKLLVAFIDSFPGRLTGELVPESLELLLGRVQSTPPLATMCKLMSTYRGKKRLVSFSEQGETRTSLPGTSKVFKAAVQCLPDKRTRDAAVDALWELTHFLVQDDDIGEQEDCVRYTEYLGTLLPFSPKKVDDTPFAAVDAASFPFEANFDALLRAVAVLDPVKFESLVTQHMEENQRTNFLCALHDHANLLLHLSKGK